MSVVFCSAPSFMRWFLRALLATSHVLFCRCKEEGKIRKILKIETEININSHIVHGGGFGGYESNERSGNLQFIRFSFKRARSADSLRWKLFRKTSNRYEFWEELMFQLLANLYLSKGIKSRDANQIENSIYFSFAILIHSQNSICRTEEKIDNFFPHKF